ncbi:hypothetical protein F66182_4917 [Fusarium sp. NRRL 66182]|nr:hypothetical protein F66182_4917 [Fusarium sp. NRRL 66182]
MATSEEAQVLIVGAGATGLLIAQGLKKAGIQATVCERESEQSYHEKPGWWNMALHWALPNVEACLPREVFSNLKQAESDPWTEYPEELARSIPMINGRTGQVLTHVKADGPKRVVRGRLRDLFKTGIDVKYGMDLSGLHVDGNTVVASFNNGTEIQKASYVVGCDGVGDVPDPQKPETWKWQASLSIWLEDIPSTPEARMQAFKHYGSNYCEPFRSLKREHRSPKMDFMSLSNSISAKFCDWRNIRPWAQLDGRVTIAGDAAHPMVPFRAQGLNNALEDAGRYVGAIRQVLIEGGDRSEIMAKYNDDVYQRGKEAIETSADQMYACHNWDTLMDSPLFKKGFTNT